MYTRMRDTGARLYIRCVYATSQRGSDALGTSSHIPA